MQTKQTEKEKPKACEKQEQEYLKCLTSFSSYASPGHFWAYCRGSQWDLKYCSEFDTWLEQTVRAQTKAAGK